MQDAERCRETLISFYVECMERFQANGAHKTRFQRSIYQALTVDPNKTGIAERDKVMLQDDLKEQMQRQYLRSLPLFVLSNEVVMLARTYLTHRETVMANTTSMLLGLVGPEVKKKLEQQTRQGPRTDAKALEKLKRAAQKVHASEMPSVIYGHLDAKYKREIEGLETVNLELKAKLKGQERELLKSKAAAERLAVANKGLEAKLKWYKGNVTAGGTGSGAAAGALVDDEEPAAAPGGFSLELPEQGDGSTTPDVRSARSARSARNSSRRSAGASGNGAEEIAREAAEVRFEIARQSRALEERDARIKELEAELFKAKHASKSVFRRLNDAEIALDDMKRALALEKKRGARWKVPGAVRR